MKLIITEKPSVAKSIASALGAVIRHGFVLQDPHETDIVTARSFNVTAGIDPVHVGEHEKFKHGTWIDLSPLAEVCGVQVGVVQFVADLDQFAHGIFFVDSDSQIHGNYYLISVSHYVILYLLSGRVLFATLLYHESSDRATLFG